MASITQVTEDYILSRATLKSCLKKGLINYSALARQISSETGVKSTEGILIAARRLREKLKSADADNDIISLLKNSSIETRNNIEVFTIDKGTYPDALIDIERHIKKAKGLFFSVEGTKSITIMIEKSYSSEFTKRFRQSIIERKEDLCLITLTCEGIGDVPGIVNHVTGLLFEAGINIEEFLSCYDDTLIAIKSSSLPAAIKLFSF